VLPRRKWTALKTRGLTAADYRKSGPVFHALALRHVHGAILLYGTFQGRCWRNLTFQGPEAYLQARGVNVEVLK